MKILIACEHSGVLREAFRKQGYDAWSCDLLRADDFSKHHIQGDVLQVLRTCNELDLLIAHPPCTHLARAGARWWGRLGDGEQEKAAQFAMLLAEHPAAKRSCIENPVGALSTICANQTSTFSLGCLVMVRQRRLGCGCESYPC